MKVVINACYGGFGLSPDAAKELGLGSAHRVFNTYFLDQREMARNDPRLVEVVERLGSDKASGEYAKLKVIEIPDDIEWEIEEYDGYESVHEKHQSWG